MTNTKKVGALLTKTMPQIKGVGGHSEYKLRIGELTFLSKNPQFCDMDKNSLTKKENMLSTKKKRKVQEKNNKMITINKKEERKWKTHSN